MRRLRAAGLAVCTSQSAIMKCLSKSHARRSHPPPQAHFPRVPGAFLADRIIVGRYLRDSGGNDPRSPRPLKQGRVVRAAATGTSGLLSGAS
jgi:hypothetical protein